MGNRPLGRKALVQNGRDVDRDTMRRDLNQKIRTWTWYYSFSPAENTIPINLHITCSLKYRQGLGGSSVIMKCTFSVSTLLFYRYPFAQRIREH